MATYWENSCSFGLRYVSWYKYLIVSLVFSHLGFWSGNLFLIAPFPDLCLLVPFCTNVWERNGIKLDTKLKVYKAVVLPTLLYVCETWTVYQRHAKRLNHFHLSCLRKLLKIKWQDKIPDIEVLKKAGMQSMHTVLKLAQLRWTRHVIRMSDERLPKKVFYGELQEGKRSQGGQKKRYKDTIKASLKEFDIPMGFRNRSYQSGEVSSTKEHLSVKKDNL